MTETQFTAVDLSQDELAFVLTLFNLNEISGFAVPPDFDEAAASAAGDSLLKRGFAVDTPEGQALHPDIAGLVTLGAMYSVALGVSVPKGGSAPNRYWFYLTADRAVFHYTPKLGIERFEAMTSAVEFGEKIAELIDSKGHTVKPGYSAFAVPKAVLAQAEKVKASQGYPAAVESLKDHNLPESFAVNVLDETKQLIIVTIRVHESETGEVKAENTTTMLIVTGATGYWLIQEDETDFDTLNAHPVDGVKALEFVAQQVAF